MASDVFLKNNEKRIKMKRILNILALILAFITVFTSMTGCVEEQNQEPVYQDYTVTAIDGLGNPISNVVINFYTPAGEKKMRITGKDGVASLKNVIAGKYEIIVEQGLSNAIVTEFKYELTEDVKDLTIVLRDGTKTMDISGNIPDNSFAYNIGADSYTAYCTPGSISYFVFNPQEPGVYKVSLASATDGATIGYYGIPMYVQNYHCAEGEYDGKSFELIIQDEATPYVIGITSENATAVDFSVERTYDPPFDPEFAPWTVITSTAEITKCDLPDDVKLKDIDVTDSNVSVSLHDDGYYYTSDGKLVYVRIGSVCDARYLDVSIAFIAGLVDSSFGQNFGGYVYDDNGEFVGKYSYNSMLLAYYGTVDEDGVVSGNYDETGVYPLNAELAEAIKCHGTSAGWWKPNTVNYLFNSVPVVLDNAWLFLCCTVE